MSKGLRLKAESAEDLPVISAALQDAILRVGDIAYDRDGHSLTLRLSRFRHEADADGERVLTGLRIDGVLWLKARGIDRSDPEAMAVLLSLDFKADPTPPGGQLHLILAGGGELLAEIECVELTLADVSAPRKTDKRPLHPVSP